MWVNVGLMWRASGLLRSILASHAHAGLLRFSLASRARSWPPALDSASCLGQLQGGQCQVIAMQLFLCEKDILS